MSNDSRDSRTLIGNGISHLGGITILFFNTVISLFRGEFKLWHWAEQVLECGIKSQPVVILTGMFTGSVLTAQTLYQLREVNMESASGAIVGVGMLRELGPVITGIMLAGRVGSAMAAQIGTMKVTDQLAALQILNIDPISFLVRPRLLAMIAVMPILMLEACVLGITAGGFIVEMLFHVDSVYYYSSFQKYAGGSDLFIAILKASTFGIVITIISCYQGFNSSRGAVGVGQSTTRAMVWSSIAILFLNFLITLIMNQIFPTGLAK